MNLKYRLQSIFGKMSVSRMVMLPSLIFALMTEMSLILLLNQLLKTNTLTEKMLQRTAYTVTEKKLN